MSSQNFTMPSNPADRKQLADMIQQASNATESISDKRSYINDIKKEAKERFNVPPKLFAQAVRVHHKQNYSEVTTEKTEFEILYETLFAVEKD